jgi:hypothetical protein
MALHTTGHAIGGTDGAGCSARIRYGVLGGQSQFAARPLRWSDLDRLLELADGPAPCQISIPEPVFGGTFQIDR